MIQSSSTQVLVLACCVLAASCSTALAANPNANADAAAANAQRQQAMANAPVDRIIVRYRSGQVGTARDIGRSASAAVSAAASRASVRLAPAARTSATAAPTYLRTLAAGGELIKLPAQLSRADADRLVQELSADPAVESAQVDLRMYPLQTSGALPNDPLLQTNQWHLIDPVDGIDVAQAWKTTQGEGVVVAVLDTGVLPDHPDLAGNLLTGYDFITDPFFSRRATAERVPGALDLGDWIVEDGDCGLFSVASDSSWHGTHVAGTVAEATNNGIGGAGVAYRAKVLPVRVLGHCGGRLSDISDAIVWASGGHVDGVPDNRDPAEVINLSLGGGGACGSAMQAAIDGAVARGTTVVVAAGNSTADVSTTTPANCANVIAVAATRATGALADYSNFGRQIDLAGPGGSSMSFITNDGPIRSFVWQTLYTGKTTPTSGQFTYGGTRYAGTSMASPHVAGTAALVQSALIADGKPPLSPAAMESLLKRTARAFPVSIPVATPAGAGIVDAGAAVARALRRCDRGDVGCQVDAQPLRNGVVQSGVSNLSGDAGVFTFQAQAGAVLSFISFGGSGQAGLYVAFGREPTATDNDGASTRRGTSQTVRFTAPRAGTYILKLEGSGFDAVSLLARQ
ncbi:S8 family serine peptidase [Xanthomonas euvesicatoria pv. euvesicatoria]|uniref:S8 family peptidase n=1 Tax=Xanthomonas euvesicatoria TaxID=456327 RepID=UPI000574728C|nr:S8 family peptidase [Xanthomonas euvesicatoria]KHL52583.1 protease [Xanthomonas euvesicatoria]KLA49260.1 protease [Xanthomonas euvesicatoria]KLA50216.1 protease [Xanthomonas euvesicatoria]KLA52892.1 protease [Xanthomonas euvesicatoria]KLA62374.1 protease [Xanthomonas euvesicatoria]